jgi:ABC-type sugar transport system ATPase subunit
MDDLAKLNDRLTKILIDMTEDMTLKEINLREKSLKCASIKLNWIKVIHQEYRRLKKLKEAENILIGKYVNDQTNLQLSGQIPRHLKDQAAINDPRIMTIREEIQNQEETVACLKDVMSYVISGFGFEVSTSEKCVRMELESL